MSDFPAEDNNQYTDLYIGNLPYSTTEEYLEGLFNVDGCRVSVKRNTSNNRSKGYAFASFPTHEAAQEIKEKFVTSRT